MQTTTIKNATTALKTLRGFIGPSQLSCIGTACRGEERDWFKAKLVELANLVESMPKTYETEGKEPIAYLHYFTSGWDFYITEKDIDQDGEGQHQAYGVANIGYGPERGYVSIVEITQAGAELDLHFKPQPLCYIEKAGGSPEEDWEDLGPGDEVVYTDPATGTKRALTIGVIEARGQTICITDKGGDYLECFAHELS
jgi:hypothetical protein